MQVNSTSVLDQQPTKLGTVTLPESWILIPLPLLGLEILAGTMLI
jgi:hypothetical protein